jgi:signal transduction histidine kinase
MQTSPQIELEPGVVRLRVRSSADEIVAALRRVDALDGLADPEYRWLAEHGIERKAAPGAVIFREGDAPIGMNIMLEGEVHIRRAQSGNVSFFIARMGQMSGVLPFSRMKGYGGTGFAVGNVWTLDILKETFPEMLAAIPSMGQRCVSVLLNRVREITRIEQQAEKLTALGKLAANLAHELNNPASAAQRSAASLFAEIRQFGDQKQRLGAALAEAGQFSQYQEWMRQTRERMSGYKSRAILPDNPLDLSDREELFRSWLEAHGVPEPWTIASAIAESPMTLSHLEELASMVSPETLAASASAFASAMRVERMAETVVNSTARIFDFIAAIKDYSYMDQAPIQEIDVPQSLENTLAMLNSRLDGVTIERDYAPNLPHISAYGSELSQVWTELIENALDAMENDPSPSEKILRLRARQLGEMVVVEVVNSGPGISPEIASRIFEPFFTTKQPGKGIGLGLDTVNRIISKHSGTVSVESKPGATCFQLRLPIDRTEAY